MNYQNIETEIDGNIGIITLNRPEVLNALSRELRAEVGEALGQLDRNEQVGCMVITGKGKAFAAGADITQMQDKSYMDMYRDDNTSHLESLIGRVRTPLIAAVNGFALGGGCEIAMMCDFILASSKAMFGQPEINLGILPGWGGTQRLTRLVGKSKAMDMCLTGRMMDAREAERSGLASRVFPAETFMEDVRTVARDVASKSRVGLSLNKECVNQALETSLQAGLLFERRTFQSAFATQDQKEGMAAFVEKRKARWSHR